MLTAQGMRQRYLLGRLNRERYISIEGLLDETYNPNQLYIQSTDVLRTMQSSYSELMGLYPPGLVPEMTEGEKESLSSRKGLPPLRFREKVLI